MSLMAMLIWLRLQHGSLFVSPLVSQNISSRSILMETLFPQKFVASICHPPLLHTLTGHTANLKAYIYWAYTHITISREMKTNPITFLFVVISLHLVSLFRTVFHLSSFSSSWFSPSPHSTMNVPHRTNQCAAAVVDVLCVLFISFFIGCIAV